MRLKGFTDSLGYVHIKKPDHPNAVKSGYVLEHILIMAEHIGRPVFRGEIVHHINGVRGDNRLENLALMTNGEHVSFHARKVRESRPVKPQRAKDPVAVHLAAMALGRLGGIAAAGAGARARFSRLTPAERSELARRAAIARWQRIPRD